MEVDLLLGSVEVIDAQTFKYGVDEVQSAGESDSNKLVSSSQDEQQVELHEVVGKQRIVEVHREPALLLYVKHDITSTSCPGESGHATAGSHRAESLVGSLTHSLRCMKRMPGKERPERRRASQGEVEVQREHEHCGAWHDCSTAAAAAAAAAGGSCSSHCSDDCGDGYPRSKFSCEQENDTVPRQHRPDDESASVYSAFEGVQKKSREHVCNVCGATFMQRSHLATHVRKHDPERRFKCNECGNCFKTKSSVYFHIKCHAGAPFVCAICSKEYSERKKLARHLRIIHASAERYPCNECGKAFNTRQKYELHHAVHSGHKPFRCDLCQKAFVYKSTFVQHVHSHKLHKSFKCNLCPKEYAVCADFRKHYRMHSDNRRFECPSCIKCFSLKGSLKNHMKIHAPEKPFKCQLCHKTFMKKESYECHMMVHNGEKPRFLCDQCSAAYYNMFALKRHYVKHTGGRKFSCEECGRAFWMKDALNVHMRVHSGLKLFHCACCPKTFAHKHSLQFHVNTHVNTGTVPNICPICRKTFVHKANLCRHIRLHEYVVKSADCTVQPAVSMCK